jgi:calreticulin
MFGPDLCGYDVSRIHAIFNHEGENLLRSPDVKLEYAEKNEFTHLYTLVVHPDDTYEILLDLESKVKGNLDEDWGWPSKIIPDPEDKKPEDWVDTKKIDDPEDVKPEGYDDIPTQIPDPDAGKPEDWDEEDDGEWEAPMIDNPEYKGPWSPKRIDNPAYKGEWVQKTIPNKDYVGGYYKYDNLAYVGFELWVVNNGSIFDNILVTDDLEYAKKVAEENFRAIKDGEKDVKTSYKAEQDRIKKEAEEEAKASEKAAAGEDGDEDDLDDEEKDEL